VENEQVLLVLLAVRMQGGQAPATGDLLKPLKAGVKLAQEQGLLVEVELPSTTKGKKKKPVVLAISQQGEAFLRQAASPEAISATAAGQVQALQKSLEAHREALRNLVKATLATKDKSKPTPNLTQLNKEVDKVSKAVEKLEPQLQKLSDTVTAIKSKLQNLETGDAANPSDGLMAKIDQGFADLSARVEHFLAGLKTGTTTKEMPTVLQKPATVSQKPVPETEAQLIHRTLRTAYDNLCLFVEFQDGMVELPRLFHEACRAYPQLSVPTFHQVLTSLWTKREVELHILNEVREAKEPDKGILRNDKLYYFLYWLKP
jgi:hypothetical protein